MSEQQLPTTDSPVVDEPVSGVVVEPDEAQVDKPWYKPGLWAFAALIVSFFVLGFLSMVAVVFGIKGIKATDPRTGKFKGYILSFVNLTVGSAFFALWFINFINGIIAAVNGS